MAISSQFLPVLEVSAQPFGGLAELRQTLSDVEIAYLLQFPGPINVVRPWQRQVNLTEYKFVPGSVYKVYDANMSFLYQVVSTTGYYGEDSRDLEWLLKTPQARYLHVLFETSDGPIIALMWVCNQLPRSVISAIVSEWEQRIGKLRPEHPGHEIFFDATSLPPGNVAIRYLIGLSTPKKSGADIKADPNVQIINSPTGAIIPFYPRRSGWCTFEFFSKLDAIDRAIVLEAEVSSGVGERRFRHYGDGLYYIELRNQTLIPPVSSIQNRAGALSSHVWFDADERLQLDIKLY